MSDSHRALHEKRQKYEWKIVVTIISFYVLTVSAIYSDRVNINNSYFIPNFCIKDKKVFIPAEDLDALLSKVADLEGHVQPSIMDTISIELEEDFETTME